MSRVVSAFLLLISLLLLSPAQGAAAPIAFSSPERARVIPWVDPPVPPREVDPKGSIHLDASDLLLVPVEPGDRVRVTGGKTAIGLATGAGDQPDVVTWLPDPPAEEVERRVDVPAWTGARFLAIRTTDGSSRSIRVEIGAPISDALAWHRFDQAVYDWLPGGSGDLAPPLEARPAWRWLKSARRALDGSPGPKRTGWLMARWLEESYRERPLVMPYFAERPLAFGAPPGVVRSPADDDGNVWWTLGPGQRLSIRGDRIDVVRLGLRAMAGGGASVAVRDGDALVRVVRWQMPARLGAAASFTPPEWIRVVPAVVGPEVRLEVLEGTVAVAAVGYKHKTDLFDIVAGTRDRGGQLGAFVRSGGDDVLGRLVDLVQRPTEDNRRALVAALQRSGVPELLLALAYGEASRLSSSAKEAVGESLEAFFALENGAIDTVLPLLRRVLEHLADVEATLPNADALSWASSSDPSLVDDDASVAALKAVLYVPHDGARPLGAVTAERYAVAHPELERAARRAREAWLGEGPWRAVPVAPGTATIADVATPIDVPGSPTCKLSGPDGQRWTLLAEPATAVDVAAVGGSHARVLVRSAGDAIERESIVTIDGVPATVHAAAGLVSVVAVKPGRRSITRSADAPPAMALIPREGTAPCRALREIAKWASVQTYADFELPSPGRATVARVLAAGARSQGKGGRPRALTVRMGTVARRAWIRGGASGQVEVPVPSEASALRVEVEEPMWIRASIRLHPMDEARARAITAKAAAEPTIDRLLERIRAATRALIRAADEPAIAPLRRERADALDALGYARLAELDRRASDHAPTEEAPPALEEEARVRAVHLPAESPPVAPLGYVARIPPLAFPSETAPLVAARQAWQRLDAEGAMRALLPSGNGGEADTLLLAAAAERVGHVEIARDALLAIGAKTHAGAAIAHASTLTADVAALQGNLEMTARAYALAEAAAESGDPALAAFARLAGAIRWVAPARVEGTAGTALVDLRGALPDAPGSSGSRAPASLAVRVRRALLDAPPEALLLSEREQLMIRVRRARGTRIIVDQRCYAVDGGPDACQATYLVDGAPARCRGARPPEGPSATWQTTRCAIPISPGDHRIESAIPETREVIAWLMVRDEGGGPPIDARVVSSWIEIDEARPIELPFAGPTVVRILARSDAGATRELAIQAGDARPTRWRLDGADDPSARRALVTSGAPLGAELERRVAITAAGKSMLRVGAPSGRVLVRVELATAIAVPPPRVDFDPPAPSPFPSLLGAEAAPPVAPVGDDRDPGPLTVGATAMLVDADVIQADNITLTQATTHTVKPYLELQGRLRRELVEDRAWMGVSPMVRLRTGEGSYGGEASFDSSPKDFVPGSELDGKVMAQPFQVPAKGSTPESSGNALGLRLRVQAFWALRLRPDAVLVPWLQHNSTRVDDRVKVLGEADGDIYTLYDASHPHYESVGLRLNLRPFVDTQLKLGASVRGTPLLDGVDRYDVRADVDALAGTDLFPWIGLSLLASYRPVTADRPEAFLRAVVNPRVTFFRWIARGQRITAGVEANVVVDKPEISPGPPLLSGWAFIGYDFTGGRGVRDFAPRDTMFRDRMEEGSSRIKRGKTGRAPAWGEIP